MDTIGLLVLLFIVLYCGQIHLLFKTDKLEKLYNLNKGKMEFRTLENGSHELTDDKPKSIEIRLDGDLIHSFYGRSYRSTYVCTEKIDRIETCEKDGIMVFNYITKK